jgi:hypothetical protein
LAKSGKEKTKMKHLIAICSVGLVLFGLANCVLGFAETPITRSYQGPDMTDGGSTNGSHVAADDFLCNSSQSITDVRWWGSYLIPSGRCRSINGFSIRFYSDVPASSAGEFSHPGDLLYQSHINNYCNETLYGYSADDKTDIYQYDAILASPFAQISGTVYWLSIVVDQDFAKPPPWEWHNSNTSWNGAAVQASFVGGGWDSRTDRDDLAFYLTTVSAEPAMSTPTSIVVPEPATVCLLGLGALSLIRRKK